MRLNLMLAAALPLFLSATPIALAEDPMQIAVVSYGKIPAGAAFRVAGPVWGPAPDVGYPVLYFTIHDDRPARQRTRLVKLAGLARGDEQETRHPRRAVPSSSRVRSTPRSRTSTSTSRSSSSASA